MPVARLLAAGDSDLDPGWLAAQALAQRASNRDLELMLEPCQGDMINFFN